MPVIGSEIAMTVREQLPQVSLSIVEAMSHVLVETLVRGEVDFILCYDVPDLPQLSRTALLQDDLVLVTLPGPRKGQPIALVEALEDSLAMPEEGDTVRTLVTRTARDLGLELKIAHEVRSVSAMKSLVSRGAASSILRISQFSMRCAPERSMPGRSPCRRCDGRCSSPTPSRAARSGARPA